MDRSSLTYANSFENGFKRNVIRTIEWLTGKLTILHLIRRFEDRGPYTDEQIWTGALSAMNVDVTTPQAEIENIPTTGPVVFVANHPHGMVDGLVMAQILAQRRKDFRILTRSLLTNIHPVADKFLIPVPFPGQSDSQEKMVAMRHAAMENLAGGGLVSLFPSGIVAHSDSLMGPVIEREWNVFTAKLIRRSGATVVPCYFPGANSRCYQMANRISPTLRQGLLIHEIARSRNSAYRPVIGKPITPDQIAHLPERPRAFVAWLRDQTLSLGPSGSG
jgi:putative hemolysin